MEIELKKIHIYPSMNAHKSQTKDRKTFFSQIEIIDRNFMECIAAVEKFVDQKWIELCSVYSQRTHIRTHGHSHRW